MHYGRISFTIVIIYYMIVPVMCIDILLNKTYMYSVYSILTVKHLKELDMCFLEHVFLFLFI